MDTPTVRLLDKDWPVILPPSFTLREELYLSTGLADGPRVWRVLSAAIGLCTTGIPGKVPVLSIGKQAEANYIKCKCDPLVYGGIVHDWLRAQSAGDEEISTAGNAILELLREGLFPTEAAIQERADFSGPQPE